jgi:lipid A ethanolaminephosphotransferase
MFLDVGRSEFSDTLARRRENLLDALQRAGFDVLWRDNNSGCKGLCDRVPNEDLTRAALPAICGGGECYDEVLLAGLQDKLDAFKRDAVVVLHMKGSHGPAYHLRYPPAFEHFKPVCRDAQFDRCDRADIVNAYDNTLRYTDHVISGAIELLRTNAKRFDTSLIYVSDHGESLGERGLYLHGVPYALAPTEQTHVPLLMWFSEEAGTRFGIDLACLREKQAAALSHDNLYHSILGLLDVQTRLYRPGQDIFRSCRAGGLGPEARLSDSIASSGRR